jgi:hypothetical protein
MNNKTIKIKKKKKKKEICPLEEYSGSDMDDLSEKPRL